MLIKNTGLVSKFGCPQKSCKLGNEFLGCVEDTGNIVDVDDEHIDRHVNTPT